MSLKQYNKFSKLLILAIVGLLLSGCDMALMNPKGQIGMEQRTLILTATFLMLIVVIPVIFMTFYFAWKYRESNKNAKYTPNWAHSNKIEMVVWGIPCIIIIILGVLTWKSTQELDPRQPQARHWLHVIHKHLWWRVRSAAFQYGLQFFQQFGVLLKLR